MSRNAIGAAWVLGLIAVVTSCPVAEAPDPSAPDPAADEGSSSVPRREEETTSSVPEPIGIKQPTKSGLNAPALTRVEDPSTVCMVNNQYMRKPQIPVRIEGRTYYGCCEMCKGRLEHDQTARFSTDPVSGRHVDKATAVIARDGANRVLYFESEANLRQYLGT